MPVHKLSLPLLRRKNYSCHTTKFFDRRLRNWIFWSNFLHCVEDWLRENPTQWYNIPTGPVYLSEPQHPDRGRLQSRLSVKVGSLDLVTWKSITVEGQI